MSDAPRTDAEETKQRRDYYNTREIDWPSFPCDFDFARQLERDLAKANEANEAWEHKMTAAILSHGETSQQLAEARSHVDALVRAGRGMLAAVEGDKHQIGLLSMRESYYRNEQCNFLCERDTMRGAIAATETE